MIRAVFDLNDDLSCTILHKSTMPERQLLFITECCNEDIKLCTYILVFGAVLNHEDIKLNT
jgi:hypothetical protein